LQLSPTTTSGIAIGELRRLSTGEVVYRHPVAGVVIILNASGVIPGAGGGGGDSFLQQALTATTDVTITHTFGRRASVKVIEDEQEVEALVSYPDGMETSQVRIQSNIPITGYVILT
jgi:hypothetical protein